MYILNLALNEIEESFESNSRVVLYDVIHPAYTIMTNDMASITTNMVCRLFRIQIARGRKSAGQTGSEKKIKDTTI